MGKLAALPLVTGREASGHVASGADGLACTSGYTNLCYGGPLRRRALGPCRY
jgi:hypothetical protein